MLLKLKVKEKEATKNIPPGPPGSLNAGERGQGRRRGAGWREEGTREAPEGGVGGDGGSVSPLSSPTPPRCSPLLGGLALLRARSCKTRAGGGSGAGAPARPRECQADVVGHLKFTEGGGRVKVMVSRVVCERVCFRRRRASAIDLPLAKSPRRCPREGAAGLPWPGRARRHPGRGQSGEQGHARAFRSANIPLFFPLPGTQGVDALGSG